MVRRWNGGSLGSLGDHESLKKVQNDLSDYECAKLRERYIKQGLIKPEPSARIYKPYERPDMASESVKRTREKMIANGTLVPGGGFAKGWRLPTKGEKYAASFKGSATEIRGFGEGREDEQSYARRVEGKHWVN